MEVVIEHFFSYPVAIIDIGQTLKKLFEHERKNAKWIENIHEHCHKNYQSESVNVLKNYPEEHKYLLQCAEFYKNEIFKWDSVPLKITTSWLTKTEKNGFSKPHHHKNSLISGVAYDEGNGFTSGKTGELFFHSPKPQPFLPCNPSSFTHENCTHYSVLSVPNRLVLFESSLMHHIGKHLGEEPRISLAFNTFPDGEIGAYDSSMFVKVGKD